ncbi:MAG: tRNA dihydrouridine synthase DusB [Candidatus Omnitrophota bacterium]|nr:tRNA dihydrouridine synthase DusB [Candidatus Omnitrophota bacterium]
MRSNPVNHLPFPRIMLAPLSGISSLPFRIINREAGCKLAFLEMICARSLSYRSKKTLTMMTSNSHDRPLGVQLLGNEIYYILKAIEKIKDYKYDILDFNAACPYKKITKQGKGAALLKEPKKLQILLAAIVKEVKLPVSVKLRLGWENAKNAVNIAKHAQDSGVRAICMHGRTRVQGYQGEVDYCAIKKVKEALGIPVIASGNIWSASLAKKMFEETGCDAIMVARGALGNPWIFKEIEEFLATGKILARPSAKEVLATMKRHLDLCIDFYGEKSGITNFRKFYIWYTRGFSKTKPLRVSVSRTNTKIQMLELIDKFIATAVINQ